MSGGTAPYSYSWNTSPVQTTATATGLPAGTYVVTVTDNVGQQATRSYTITEPAALTVGGSQVGTCTGAATGTATATPSGGTAPYTYSWNTSPVQTTATATGLAAGTYLVTVTDSKGCAAATRSYTLTNTADTTPPVAVAKNVTLTLDATGTATLTAADVNNGSTDNCGVASLSVSRSSFGCADLVPPASTSLALTKASNQYVLSNVGLSGTTTGTFETWLKTTATNPQYSGIMVTSRVAADGGSNSYVELYWNGAGRVASEGMWTVTQTASSPALNNGQWHHVALVANGSSCTLYIDGTANATGTVAAAGTVFTNRRLLLGAEVTRIATLYTTVELDNSRVWSVARTAAQITDGKNNITPTDVTGLQVAYTYENGTGSALSDVSGNGRAATLYPSTSLPAWNVGGGVSLPGTPVTLTVRDAAGNSSSATAYVTVQQPASTPTLNLSATAVAENSPVGTAVGTLSLGNTGPCPAPTTYQLVNAAGTDYAAFSIGTGSAANQLLLAVVPDFETKASYTVQLRAADANGVSVLRSFTITVGDLIELSGSQTTACGSNTGTASVAVAGSATGYTYSWSTTPAQTTATATGLAAGTYTVSVSKAGLTPATQTVSVPSDLIAPIAVAKNVTLTLDATGTATLTGADVDNGSTDNCGIASRSVSRSSFSCADLTPPGGRTSLTLTKASNQYVLSNAGLSGTTTGTFETWLKTSVANPGYSGIMVTSTAATDGGNDSYVALYWNGGGRVASEGMWMVTQAASSPALNNGQWHHVALVANGSSCTLYIDGTANATGTVAAAGTVFTSRRLLLGAERSRTAGYYTTVELDNSRVWSVARTAAQITDGKNNITPTDVTGLQVAYTYENGTGSALSDVSGNGRAATLYPSTSLPAWNVGGGVFLPGTPVTLTVTDAAGNQHTATARVTVQQPSAASAPALTWTGTAGTTWSDCGNWSYGLVPGATQTVTIPAGLNNYPALSSGTATLAGLTVASGASFALASGATLQVSGNVDNQGPTLAGTVVLNGTGAQTVAGSFGTLTMNKASGTAALGADASVSTALTLTNGVLTTGSNTLTLGETATLSETTVSYVTGTVQTTRDLNTAGTANTFGDLGLTLTPAAGSTVPGSTLVKRVTGTARTGISGRTGILRSFDIQPAVNTGLDVTLALSYRDAELNGIEEGSLALFKSETGAADTWGRQRNASFDAAANTATLAGVRDFSVWTLGSASAPLPVELAAFTATVEGRGARLKWTTASEKNNAYFDVERSLDGREFRQIGQERGQGSKATATSYTFLDKQLPTGTTYYRLRQVDVDGTASYSPVRTVTTTAVVLAAALSIYPTEAVPGQPLRYAYTGPALPAGTTLDVYDATGRCLHRQAVGGAAGALEVKGLSSGWYWVRLQGADGPQQARFYQP